MSAPAEVKKPAAAEDGEQTAKMPQVDGSAVWRDIRDDKRLLELRECLYQKVGGPTPPSGTVLMLFCVTCAGLGAMFLLLVFHGFGHGTFFSDASGGVVVAAEHSGINNTYTVQCVCSAKPSEVITQLAIVMLVVLSAGSASFFMYFFDQTARAVHAATVIVDGCQEVLTDREHAINELVAGQKTDMIRMQYLEKMVLNQARKDSDKGD